jgi:hypothetical protein
MAIIRVIWRQARPENGTASVLPVPERGQLFPFRSIAHRYRTPSPLAQTGRLTYPSLDGGSLGREALG